MEYLQYWPYALGYVFVGFIFLLINAKTSKDEASAKDTAFGFFIAWPLVIFFYLIFGTGELMEKFSARMWKDLNNKN